MKRSNGSVVRRVAAAALSLSLGVSTFCATVVLASTTASAETLPLSIPQATELGTSLRSALDAAKCNHNLIRNAISRGLTGAIDQYGTLFAESITAAILLESEQYGQCVSAADIGYGLALAAAPFEPNDPRTASLIASMIANVGTEPEIAAFLSNATQLGYADLVSVASSPPKATGAIGNSGNSYSSANPNGFFGTALNPAAGCLNPTCTKL